jgi:hypothetical protein
MMVWPVLMDQRRPTSYISHKVAGLIYKPIHDQSIEMIVARKVSLPRLPSNFPHQHFCTECYHVDHRHPLRGVTSTAPAEMAVQGDIAPDAVSHWIAIPAWIAEVVA